jgi:hypothetical protein
MGDGVVKTFSDSVDLKVWWAIGTRDQQERDENF